jgi:hypothetical protein
MVSALPVSNASQGGRMVSAPPVSNAPCDEGASGAWSGRDQSAWLPTSTAVGPGVSERIDPSISTVSYAATGNDPVIGRFRSSRPVDSSVTTVSCTTIDSVSIASATGPPTIASLDHENLQTEPNFRPEREPNNPNLSGVQIRPNDPAVPRSEPERHNADAAGCQDDPNRRLKSATVLGVSAVLLLYGSSLLADAARRTPRAQGEVSRRAATSSPTPTQRARFDVAPSARRPEGAVTNQPRATPWDHSSPDGAKQNSVFHGQLGRRDSRDLWHPYTACASSESWLRGAGGRSRRNQLPTRFTPPHLPARARPGPPSRPPACGYPR